MEPILEQLRGLAAEKDKENSRVLNILQSLEAQGVKPEVARQAILWRK